MREIKEKDLGPMITDITKEDFIEKVKRQHYYIDAIDAFRLIDFYTYEFGVLITYLEPEQELAYMFQKIMGRKVLKRDFYPKRVCAVCKIEKSCNQYKDRIKHKTCAECLAISTKKYRRKKGEG